MHGISSAEWDLNTEKVHLVERKTRDGKRRKTFRYALCCEQSPYGTNLYYIKAHVQQWDGAALINEAIEVAGGLGGDRQLALAIFAKICEASHPLSPEHLPEVVRDEAFLHGHRSPAGRGNLAARERPATADRRAPVLYLAERRGK